MYDDRLDIVYALDSSFVVPTAVSMASLLAHNVGEYRQIHFHLLCQNVAAPDYQKFQNLIQSFDTEKESNIELHFYKDITLSVFEGLPVSSTWPVAAWLRALIPHLLPSEVHSCLYLDGDTLVLGSLHPMLSADVADCDVAGVCTGMVDGAPPEWRDVTGALRKDAYIGSYMLFFSPARWRAQHYTERILNYATQHVAQLHYPDMDAINGALSLKACMPEALCKTTWVDIETALRKPESEWPVLVHYNGGAYTKGYFLLLPRTRRLFHVIKQGTPWNDEPDYRVRGVVGRLKVAAMFLLYFTPLKWCAPGFFKLYAQIRGWSHSFAVETESTDRQR